jgi:hypothetical protein
MDYNGSSVGLAVIMGELRAESRHQTAAIGRVIQAIERQNDILLDLPARMATTISQTSASPSSGRLLPELSDLVRALYPVLILLAALAGKSALPETGLLRTVLEAVIGGAVS